MNHAHIIINELLRYAKTGPAMSPFYTKTMEMLEEAWSEERSPYVRLEVHATISGDDSYHLVGYGHDINSAYRYIEWLLFDVHEVEPYKMHHEMTISGINVFYMEPDLYVDMPLYRCCGYWPDGGSIPMSELCSDMYRGAISGETLLHLFVSAMLAQHGSAATPPSAEWINRKAHAAQMWVARHYMRKSA